MKDRGHEGKGHLIVTEIDDDEHTDNEISMRTVVIPKPRMRLHACFL